MPSASRIALRRCPEQPLRFGAGVGVGAVGHFLQQAARGREVAHVQVGARQFQARAAGGRGVQRHDGVGLRRLPPARPARALARPAPAGIPRGSKRASRPGASTWRAVRPSVPAPAPRTRGARCRSRDGWARRMRDRAAATSRRAPPPRPRTQPRPPAERLRRLRWRSRRGRRGLRLPRLGQVLLRTGQRASFMVMSCCCSFCSFSRSATRLQSSATSASRADSVSRVCCSSCRSISPSPRPRCRNVFPRAAHRRPMAERFRAARRRRAARPAHRARRPADVR